MSRKPPAPAKPTAVDLPPPAPTKISLAPRELESLKGHQGVLERLQTQLGGLQLEIEDLEARKRGVLQQVGQVRGQLRQALRDVAIAHGVHPDDNESRKWTVNIASGCLERSE